MGVPGAIIGALTAVTPHLPDCSNMTFLWFLSCFTLVGAAFGECQGSQVCEEVGKRSLSPQRPSSQALSEGLCPEWAPRPGPKEALRPLPGTHRPRVRTGKPRLQWGEGSPGSCLSLVHYARRVEKWKRPV